MADILLKHFEQDPHLDFQVERTFPLLERLGSKAFRPDGKLDWDFLRKAYGDETYIWGQGTPLEWREEILTLADLESHLKNPTGGSYHLEGYATDSFTVQAQRKGFCSDLSFIETVIYGFTRADGHLLLGVRGGIDQQGMILAVPGGAVSFCSEGNPLQQAVYQEGREEAAISSQEVGSLETIGVFRHNAVENFFVHMLNLNVPLDEIRQRHRYSIGLYNYVKSTTKGNDNEKEVYVRRLLAQLAQEDPKIARDCWENDSVMLVPDEPEALLKFIDQAQKQGKGLLPSMLGAFSLYFLHVFGEQYYGRLRDMPQFTDQVVEGFV